MLAPDAIYVRLDGAALALRPTLRAAMRLNRREGGFAAISQGILDGDMATMADVIEEAADHPTAIVDLMRDVALHGASALLELQAPLLAYLGQLLDVDGKAQADTASTTPAAPVKTISRGEQFQQLFEIGTGYIGWTPAETWAASPAEILAAFKGRQDFLRSIFGGADERPTDTSIPLSKRVSATMKALGAVVVKRQKHNPEG